MKVSIIYADTNLYHKIVFKYCLLNFSLYALFAAVSPYLQIMLTNKGYSQTFAGFCIAGGQTGAIVFPLIFGFFADKTGNLKHGMFFGALFSLIFFAIFEMFSMPIISFICFFIAQGMYQSTNSSIDGYMNRQLHGDSQKYGFARSFGTLGYFTCLLLFGIIGFPDVGNNRQIILNIGILVLVFFAVLAIVPKSENNAENNSKNGTQRKIQHKTAEADAQQKDIADTRQVDNAQQKVSDNMKQEVTANTQQTTKPAASKFDWLEKSFLLLVIIVGINKIALGVIDLMFSSYLSDFLNLANRFTLFVAVGNFCEFLTFIVMGNLLKKGKIAQKTLLMLSFVSMFVRLSIYAVTKVIPLILFAQSLHSLIFACNQIAVTDYIAKNINNEHKALATGFYWSFGVNLPNTIGVLLAGFLIDKFGYMKMFGMYSVLPIISIVLFFCFRRRIFETD